jgi:prepilin-type processing-associated H-X9-DG protein
MVVIGIIVVLAAMLLPMTKVVRNAAKTAECGGRMRQLGFLFTTYIINNRGRFLPPGPGSSWTDYNRNLLSIQASGLAGFNNANLGEVANAFMCSEDKWKVTDFFSGVIIWDMFVSHGYNLQILGGRMCGTHGAFRLIDVVNPSETVLAADSRNNQLPAWFDANLGGAMLGTAGPNSVVAYPRHRYNTQCMVLWVDGHASPVQAAGPNDFISLYSATRLGGTISYNPATDTFSNSTITSMWDTK